MKKLKLKSWGKDTLGIMLFYSIIVFGVLALNTRFGYLNNKKSVDSIGYRKSTQMPR